MGGVAVQTATHLVTPHWPNAWQLVLGANDFMIYKEVISKFAIAASQAVAVHLSLMALGLLFFGGFYCFGFTELGESHHLYCLIKFPHSLGHQWLCAVPLISAGMQHCTWLLDSTGVLHRPNPLVYFFAGAVNSLAATFCPKAM